MKKIFLFPIGLILLIACNNPAEKKEEQNISKNIVGGKKDDHGCLASAGQTWSKLNNSCVQIFNIGLRLNPVDSLEKETIFSAFILSNNDSTKVEVFLPNDTISSVILNLSDVDVFTNNNYTYNSAEKTLYENGLKTFTSK